MSSNKRLVRIDKIKDWIKKHLVSKRMWQGVPLDCVVRDRTNGKLSANFQIADWYVFRPVTSKVRGDGPGSNMRWLAKDFAKDLEGELERLGGDLYGTLYVLDFQIIVDPHHTDGIQAYLLAGIQE